MSTNPGADPGEALLDRWGTVPLSPLAASIARSAVEGQAVLPFLTMDGDPAVDRAAPEQLAADPGAVLSEVVVEHLGAEARMATYRTSDHKVVINEDHPFVREYASTREERQVVRDLALASLLSDAALAEISQVPTDALVEFDDFRDRVTRLIARTRRPAGPALAELLEEAGRHQDYRAMEVAVGEALELIGFDVQKKAKSGEPEGVASGPRDRSREGEPYYKFTYDAKSTTSSSGRVRTGDMNFDGLVRHREDEDADYTLVVGPDYSAGELSRSCETHRVTAMRAADLSRLIMLHAGSGPLSLPDLEVLFDAHRPDDVAEAVDRLIETYEERQDGLILSDVLDAIEDVGHERVDVLTTSVISHELQRGGAPSVREQDVRAVLAGLEVVAPTLIRLDREKVYLAVSAAELRRLIRDQVSRIPDDVRFGLFRSFDPALDS